MDAKQCRKCMTAKPVSEFYRSGTTRDGLLAECKECWDGRNRAWQEANRERHLASRRAAQAKRRQAMTPEAKEQKYDQDYRKLKRELFDHYGWECACCGSAANLTIDHIHGNGAEHRATVTGDPRGRKGGDKVYREIRRQGFPAGYQVLCMPCNNSKGSGPQCRMHHGDVRAEAARVLHAAGWTFKQIAEALGVSRSRAHQFCNEEPTGGQKQLVPSPRRGCGRSSGPT